MEIRRLKSRLMSIWGDIRHGLRARCWLFIVMKTALNVKGCFNSELN